MMGCNGCTSTCGCNVVAGPGIQVQKIGSDKYIVSSTLPDGAVPVFISPDDPGALGYSYVWYEVDGGGVLIDTHVVWVEP